MALSECLKSEESIRPKPKGRGGDSRLEEQLAMAATGAAGGTDFASAAQSRITLLEAVAENFPGGIALFDHELTMVFCNAKLRELLDYPDTLFADGYPSMETVFRFNAARGEYGAVDVNEIVTEKMALAAERREHQYERVRPDGTVLEVRGVPLPEGGFLTTYVDTTEQHRHVRHLDAVVDHFPGGIALFDSDLRMVFCNAQLREMLNYPDSLFATGNPSLEDIFRFNARRGEYGEGDIEEHVARRLALVAEQSEHDYERVRPDGTVLEVRGVPLADGGFVTTYADVTQRKRHEALIAHMAMHDGLTDLPNRALFNDRLQNAIEQAARGYQLALHYLDLDRFKPVNDQLGHAVGDLLLQEVAGRLRKTIRKSDTVARIGGDEFVVLQTGAVGRNEAERLASRLLEAVSRPMQIEGETIDVGASIGISLAPEHGLDAEILLKLADRALYQSKNNGRGIYSLASS